MGTCCSPLISIQGEEFLRQLLSSKSLKIRQFDYSELLNQLISQSNTNNNKISKYTIRNNIIPIIYDIENAGDYNIYYQSIFELILSQFDNEENNIYKVLFYFLPFIKYSKENAYQYLFNCIKFMSKSNRLEIELNIINQSLLKYFTFCTKDITFCIYQKSVNNYELSVSLSSLINHIYSESKIKKFNDKIINLLTGKDPVNLITKSRFQKMFQFYDISSIENIRDFFLHDV